MDSMGISLTVLPLQVSPLRSRPAFPPLPGRPAPLSPPPCTPCMAAPSRRCLLELMCCTVTISISQSEKVGPLYLGHLRLRVETDLTKVALEAGHSSVGCRVGPPSLCCRLDRPGLIRSRPALLRSRPVHTEPTQRLSLTRLGVRVSGR